MAKTSLSPKEFERERPSLLHPLPLLEQFDFMSTLHILPRCMVSIKVHLKYFANSYHDEGDRVG